MSKPPELKLFPSSKSLTNLVCLFDYKGATEQELDFNKDDEMMLINDDNKDWWFVENQSTGEKGYIPATYVRVLERDRVADIDQDEASDSVDGSESQSESQDESQNEDSQDSGDEESEATEASQGKDSDSQESKDSENDQVKELLQDLQKRKSRSRRKHLPPTLPLFDSSLPQGFRPSTLFETIKGGSGRYQEYLTPELSSNGLSFKDVHYDAKNMIRKRQVKCSLAFTIKMGKNIPYSGDLDVVGRHVRLSLFDKSHILSNIHSVPATVVDDEGTWSFKTQKGLWKEEQGCFVRSDEVDIKLCMLFELCLVVRPKATDVQPDVFEEICCGWSMLPLYTIDGNPLEPKSYEMILFGGTPYDHEIDLAPSPTKSTFLGRFSSGNRQPRLTIKIWNTKKKLKNQLDDLPDLFVGSIKSIPLLMLYRKALAHSFLHGSKQGFIGSRYDPVLSLLPIYLEQPDVLICLIDVWEKRLKQIPRKDKKSFTRLKRHFSQTILLFYPFLFIPKPAYIPGNVDVLLKRAEMLQKLVEDGPSEFYSKYDSCKTFEVEELDYQYVKRVAVMAPIRSPISAQ